MVHRQAFGDWRLRESEPLRLLITNHEGHEEYKEKQEVALIFLRELRFFVVRVNSTYRKKSAKQQ
jgi:hypothetical protein